MTIVVSGGAGCAVVACVVVVCTIVVWNAAGCDPRARANARAVAWAGSAIVIDPASASKQAAQAADGLLIEPITTLR